MMTHPLTHVAFVTKPKSSMTSRSLLAFSTLIKMFCPSNKLAMNAGVFFRRKYHKIFAPIINRIAVLVMNYASMRDPSKNKMMFKYPARFSFAKSIPIAAFAPANSYGSNWILVRPTFPIFFPIRSSTFWRACRSTKWSIALKNLSADRATTEVLSHATE